MPSSLLDEALSNSGGGSCDPIYIDLLEGWNIMGYTLPNPQDVAATLSSIVSNVQIVKIIQLMFIGQNILLMVLVILYQDKVIKFV